MDRVLKGIVVDPGHGGSDSGAINGDNLEKEYNLLISKYMVDRFNELGVNAELTRDNDVTLSPKERTNKVLSFFGNDKDIIVLSNHLNAGGGEGAEIIYSLRNDSRLANSILNNFKSSGQKVRKVFQKRLPSDVTKDYYFMLRDTGNTEALIIEYGFIDNKNDISFIKDNYKELVEDVIKAVMEYKGLNYVEPDKVITDEYIVKSGDTLYGISKKLNTSVNELVELNDLKGNLLSIGMKLKIPTKSVDIGDFDLYQVKSGDTLYKIANSYNTSVNYLKSINNLSNDNLSIGMLLKVPSGLDLVNTYNVKKGDTLYSIAKNFNVDISKLKDTNNLSNDNLFVGQNIIIPVKSKNTYKVEKGDTLYSISKKFNVSVNKLIELNNIKNNMISIGQILILE